MKINGVIAMLKKKAPKIIQINDILQWYDNGELELSPKYQRNSVWNEKAKSAGLSLNAYITQAVDSYAGISPDEDKIAEKALEEARREIIARIEQALKPYKIQKDEETTDE